MSIKKYISLIFILFIFFLSQQSIASLSTHVRICAVKGTVITSQAYPDNGQCALKRTMDVTECRIVNEATIIETGSDGFAEVEYRDGSKIKIGPNTKIRLENNKIYVDTGSTWFKIEKQKDGKLIVRTPTAIAGIRGTEFIVDVKKDGSSDIQLIKGSIEVSDVNNKSNMMLAAGIKVTIPAGSSTLNTGLLNIQKNDEWWTDWPTLVPISEMPGYSETPVVNSGEQQIPPVADAYVYAYSYRNWNRSNRGKYEQLVAGWNPIGGESRIYVKFDIHSINASNSNKVFLRLFHSSTSGNSNVELGVYRVSSPWLEGTDTYHSGQTEKTAAPGEITWVQQPTFNNSAIATFNPGMALNHWVDVDITTVVKQWLAGFQNNGLVIKPVENLSSSTSESLYHFASKEWQGGSNQPILILSDSNLKTAVSFLSIAGQWNLNQDNGYAGIMNIQQSSNGHFTGDVIWNGYLKGTIDGTISGNIVDFNVDYHNGDIGHYKGTLTQNETRIINGTSLNTTNGVSANWTGNKVVSSLSIAGQWNLNQDNGYTGIMNIQQDSDGYFTGNVIWNGNLEGTIDGKISGNVIEFTISYPDGIEGLYKGTLTQDETKIINGTSKANNGTSATWNASR
ncbi:MAG: DNRLRE domain-containing protein [Draconibacterium sp.]|nr:DNRLRE domain-containing protein [Draconibacterium sp.]